MPVKFKNSININDQYTLPTQDGSNGQALITDGSGNISFGSTGVPAPLYIDYTNNRLGIGTSSPSYKLDVAGAFHVKDGNSAVAIQEYSSGATIWMDGVDGDFTGGDYFNISAYGATDLAFGHSAATKMTLKNTGNLGIGTTSPSAKLEVSDNNTTKTAIHIDNTSTGGNRWDVASIGSGVSGRVGNLQIRNDSDSLNIVEITEGGNVGIGTTSPSKKLHVNSGSTNDVALFESTDSFANIYLKDNSGEMALQKVGTDVLFVTENSSTHGNLRFLSNSGTERMRINSAGNVGIGTTAPRSLLNVTGTGSAGGILTLENDSESLITDRKVGQIHFYSNDGSTNGAGVKADINAIVENSIGSEIGLTFGTSGTSSSTAVEAMRIDSAGNVGIGTASPAANAKLTVMGNQTFGLPGSGANTSGRFISIEGNADSSGEGSARVFFTEHNSSTAAMDNYGMSIGYRGGGTSITGTSGNIWTGLSQINNGDWGMWGHDNNATGSLIMSGDRAATYVSFKDNIVKDINELRVSSKVGIGNDAPAFTLDLGGIDEENSTDFIRLNPTNGNGGNTSQTIGTGIVWKPNYSTYTKRSAGIAQIGEGNYFKSGLAFYTNGTSDISTDWSERMRIDMNGNVGIGTASPDSALHIESTSNTNSPILTIENDDAKQIELGVVRSAAGTNPNTSFLAYDNDFRFIAGAGSTNEIMRIDSSGQAYFKSSTDYKIGLNDSNDVNQWWLKSYTNGAFAVHENGVGDKFTILAGGNATFANSVTVGGNLIVNGTTTTLNTQTVEVEDNILQLNTTQGTPDTATAATAGISVYRGNGVTQASLIFDEADDTWDLTNNLQVAGDLTVSGGDIVLSGTGRIQGIDTVTASTDAVNKSYVDSIVATPVAPTNLSLTIVGETVNVTFDKSTTADIDLYFVFGSSNGSDYSLISVLPPDDHANTMSIIDDSFDDSGTQAYRVYAQKNGVISANLNGNISYSVTSPLEPTNLSVVSLNSAYYVQWDPPSSNSRFITAYNVYKHEHASSGSLARSSASLVYSGMNTNYMYQISGADNTNYHQFWVETTTT